MFTTIKHTVQHIKKNRPIILNITNAVTVDFVANGLLSLGASPVMSHAREEIADLLRLASAVAINLGTLDENFLLLCDDVCAIANQLQKPIILDPVGAGASCYRTEASLHLLNQYRIAIVRGNASEIKSLTGATIISKGVDSLEAGELAIDSAKTLSQQFNTAVVVSGAIDYVIDGDYHEKFVYGSPLMPLVTGTGCLLTAVCAGFHAVEKNRFIAAKLATVFYGICGGNAARKANGPASFKTHFIDELNKIPNEDCDDKT